jgi:hypothetical protein
MTPSELLRVLNTSSPTEYGLVRVLRREDRTSFYNELCTPHRARLRSEMVRQHGMRLLDWLEMLSALSLQTRYIVYRRAYAGEAWGHARIHSRLASQLVPMWVFEPPPCTSSSWIRRILTECRRILTGCRRVPTIHVVVDQGARRMWVVNPRSPTYCVSGWSNPEVRLPNDVYR